MANYEQYGYSAYQYSVACQVHSYFKSAGWTENAIYGMLGNMMQESSLIPDSWQGGDVGNTAGGMGLVQWTPGTKLLNWCNNDNRNLDWKEINTQCQFIEYELNNGGQWQEKAYNTTFAQYVTMTESPGQMARIFCSNFEQAGDPVTSARVTYAQQWSEILGGATTEPSGTSNPGHSSSSNQGGKIIITVQSGDTLSQIAQTYNVSVQDILNWNPSITNANNIYVGERIVIYTTGNPSGSTSGTPAPSTKYRTNIPVVDISDDNGSVDFENLKSAGIEIIYIQSTNGMNELTFNNGDGTESYLEAYYNAAKKYGFKVGFYHFAVYGDQSAADQARFFYNTVKDYDDDCIYMVDIESSGNFPMANDPTEVQNWVSNFMSEFENCTDATIGMYGNRVAFNNTFNDSFAKYPLWSANWVENPCEQPIIMPSGTSYPGTLNYWNKWVGWQWNICTPAPNYCSSTGGIDLDVFTSDVFKDHADSQPLGNNPGTPSGGTPSVNSKPAINTGINYNTNGGINIGNQPTYNWNARVITSQIDILNLDGSSPGDYYTTAGDHITILDIDGDQQMALIQYPDQSAGVYQQGWIPSSYISQDYMDQTFYALWTNNVSNQQIIFHNGLVAETTLTAGVEITFLYTVEYNGTTYACVAYIDNNGNPESGYVPWSTGTLNMIGPDIPYYAKYGTEAVSLTFASNAVTKASAIDIVDINGISIPNSYTSTGDNILILGVYMEEELVYIEYPDQALGVYYTGYVSAECLLNGDISINSNSVSWNDSEGTYSMYGISTNDVLYDLNASQTIQYLYETSDGFACILFNNNNTTNELLETGYTSISNGYFNRN